MWLAPATQSFSRTHLRRRIIHNSNCLKSVRSVWKVLSRFERLKGLYHFSLPLWFFRRVYDKTCADQPPLKSLHPKRAQNKICFSVFWKSNQKAWMLKQLLSNLFKKKLLCWWNWTLSEVQESKFSFLVCLYNATCIHAILILPI